MESNKVKIWHGIAAVCCLMISGTLAWQNWSKSHVEKRIQAYRGKDDATRLEYFRADFSQALKNPSRMVWINRLYTEGLMSHISYSEFGPSFEALVRLHQAFEVAFQQAVLPSAMRTNFQNRFDLFLNKNKELENVSEVCEYENKLENIYREFLVSFMMSYQDFFQQRFLQNITHIKQNGQLLDTIDCSFFALKDGWPGQELLENKSDRHKLQCEPLYVYRCGNGQIMILGYNTYTYTCGSTPHIAMWNPKTPVDKPVDIPIPAPSPRAEFELSPDPHAGGCGRFDDPKDFVQFDGRYLTFEGYDYMIYRKAKYDTTTHQWTFEEKEAVTPDVSVEPR